MSRPALLLVPCLALLAGCATLPATGAPATGELLQVHAENVTHTWTSKDKVATVEHKDEHGRSIGQSDVYEDRQHSATSLEWFPQQGESRVDDQDFFAIAGDLKAAREIEDYRQNGLLMNHVGLGLVAAGVAALIGGFAANSAQSSAAASSGTGTSTGFSGVGYGLTLGGALLAGTGGYLTWFGIARENPAVHPLDLDRAQVAAARYNAGLLARNAAPVPAPVVAPAAASPAIESAFSGAAAPRAKVTDAPVVKARSTAMRR
jgi:hypothetical protein